MLLESDQLSLEEVEKPKISIKRRKKEKSKFKSTRDILDFVIIQLSIASGILLFVFLLSFVMKGDFEVFKTLFSMLNL